ncbi:hypothetical protein, partial [Caballeronia glebae]|uniref:hypothetical protein n=1 Tax=Caballeronia glebae TaxID=1777143 RepID=UPI0038B96E38
GSSAERGFKSLRTHAGVEQIFLAQNGLSMTEAMGPSFVTSHREDGSEFNLRCVLRFAQRLAHHP